MAMFVCKSCGCNESVCVRTYPGEEETVRLRRCLKCGEQVRTRESILLTDSTTPKKKRGRPPKSMLDAAMEGLE